MIQISFIIGDCSSKNSQLTARWYSSWVLFFAYLPIFMLLAVWLPLTIQGRLEAADNIRNKSFVERKSKSFTEYKLKSVHEKPTGPSSPTSSPFHRPDSDRMSSATDIENARITAANTTANLALSGPTSIDSTEIKVPR